MGKTSSIWPILELIENELDPGDSHVAEPSADSAELVEADALFMAGCDVFLERVGIDGFVLTLKRSGHVSEIRLTAGVDDEGAPALVAFVA